MGGIKRASFKVTADIDSEKSAKISSFQFTAGLNPATRCCVDTAQFSRFTVYTHSVNTIPKREDIL